MSDRPRTDAADLDTRRDQPETAYYKMRDFAEKLERELAAVTKERDEAREALREIVSQIVHIGGQYYQLSSIDKDEVVRWRKAAGLDA